VKIKHIALAFAAPLGASFSSLVRAEEGGSGHYLPGAMASFVDAVPPQETFIVQYNLLYYNGSFGGNPIPFAGFLAELKWLHEVETQRRLEGDYVWLKVVFKF
jgi:hypothetical protein